MIKRGLIYSVIFFLFIGATVSCGGGDDAPPPIPKPPAAATLIAPENNLVCLTGVSINDTQSEVDFSWNSSQNTDSYDIVVKNLNVDQTTTYNSNTNSTKITLLKGEPYSWYVKSKSGSVTQTAESTVWKFYLAGDGKVHYAPFPASIVHPVSGATVNGMSTFLKWMATDVDNDIVSYEVYFDQTDGSTLLDIITEMSVDDVVVESGKIYYWKVLVRDSQANVSDSGVLTFKVK